MVEWVLSPLVDGGKMDVLYERRKAEVVAEWLQGGFDVSPGSKLTHYRAASEQFERLKSLAQRFPQLEERAAEFTASDIFRSMPALRYPPVLRAAIAVMSGRRPKRGDGHDIVHLTRGLSRCDIVTADAGMTQLCVDHKLVPEGCTLLRFNDVDGLASARSNRRSTKRRRRPRSPIGRVERIRRSALTRHADAVARGSCSAAHRPLPR